MAYSDLVSSGETVVADSATTYNFAFDSPISQDSSPHIVFMGFQLDATAAAALAPIGTIGKLITSLRVKVGSNILVDWDSSIAYESGSSATTSVAQLSVLAQTLGGEDYFWGQPDAQDNELLTGISFPVGLDATKSHRVNVTIGFDDMSDWVGAVGGLNAGGELNVSLGYGTATEATMIGAGQQFTHSASATRVVTIHGKTGWQMLGVLICNDTETDETTEIRVNNGQFRALRPDQWRTLNGRTSKNPIRAMDTLTAEANTNPNYLTRQPGTLFMDLRRITAGSSIDISVQTSAATTIRYYPVYVAAINAKSGSGPKQTISKSQSTSSTVVNES